MPDPGVEDRLQDALVEAAPLSVVWKRRTASARPPPPAARFYMTSWLPSTVAVLKHSNTRMFLTHCGVTSLLASVEAVVPNVGLPLFAGQADACQRVEEVGIRLPSSETKAFTRAGVVAVIAAVTENHSTPWCGSCGNCAPSPPHTAAHSALLTLSKVVSTTCSSEHNTPARARAYRFRCKSSTPSPRGRRLRWLVWVCVPRRLRGRCLPIPAVWSMLWRTTRPAKAKRGEDAAPSRAHVAAQGA